MIEARIQVSVVWGVLMIIYFVGDLLRISNIADVKHCTQATQFRQPIWLGISMLMIIPILMLVLIMMLPQPISRWTNIVIAGFSLLTKLMGLPDDPGTYDGFLIVVGFILNIVTLWLSWNHAVI